MKKVVTRMRNHILICTFFFMGFSIIVSFILYLLGIRFRTWLIIGIILLSIAGLTVGIFQQVYKYAENQRSKVILSLLGMSAIISLFILFLPFLLFAFLIIYKPEHTVQLDNQKYVAVVQSFLNVDVRYYDYYGPFLMGTKVRVHGDYGEGGYDPIKSPDLADSVTYTYYDDNGKIKSRKMVRFKKDEEGKVNGSDSHIIDIKPTPILKDSENYILPEEEEILYEKKFGKKVLRFGKVDTVLKQNILVNVLKSTDNGKNFYVVSDDVVEVSNTSKYLFLNQELGFILSSEKVYLKNNKGSLYVTQDGGKTFAATHFEYENSHVEFMSMQDMPYYEENKLKTNAYVYEVNSAKDRYENKKLTFVSDDNGVNWYLEKS